MSKQVGRGINAVMYGPFADSDKNRKRSAARVTITRVEKDLAAVLAVTNGRRNSRVQEERERKVVGEKCGMC